MLLIEKIFLDICGKGCVLVGYISSSFNERSQYSTLLNAYRLVVVLILYCNAVIFVTLRKNIGFYLNGTSNVGNKENHQFFINYFDCLQKHLSGPLAIAL